MLSANKFKNAIAYNHPRYAQKDVRSHIRLMSIEKCSYFLTAKDFMMFYYIRRPRPMTFEMETEILEKMFKVSLSMQPLQTDEERESEIDQILNSVPPEDEEQPGCSGAQPEGRKKRSRKGKNKKNKTQE